MDNCCGNCKWHKPDKQVDDFVCDNCSSDYYTDYTPYEFECEEWEERE